MSSPEVEKFEITDEDLLNEFNPNRPTYRQTKSKATYGVWAHDSDEEDRPGFGKNGKQKKNYTAPIGFVSGGVKVGDKISKEGNSDDERSDSEVDDDDVIAHAAAIRKKPTKRGYVPGAQGNASLGQWERHTTGIASKLMEKMGYVPGKGLGKNLHGISTPVEAKKRSGKGTVGYHGSERTERSLVDFPAKADSGEEADKEFHQQLQQWKKPSENKKKKPKYVYKTASELIKEGSAIKPKHKMDTSNMSKVKVIDMTGREQRILSGYHAIAHKHDVPEDESSQPPPTSEKRAFDMPELLHNLDLLVEMSEDEIIQSDRKLKYEQDLVINLRHEKENMDILCSEEEKQINRMKDVLSIISECEQRSHKDSENPMSLDEYATALKELQDNYYDEYKAYELSHIAVALVFPLLNKEFEGWSPLYEPQRCLRSVQSWKDIIESNTVSRTYQGESQMSTYERLIWEVWMPYIRRTISEQWSVRHPDTLLELLEAWLPLLPQWVMNNILELLVLPKLQKEVEDWNPLTDTMPIHAWMHPWLPLMGDLLEPLYAPIRHKLSNALNNWHPSDPSAKMILEPWKPVWKQGNMDIFIIKNIMPKLTMCMQEFAINPHQQHLDPWNWIMSWLEFIPHTHMVGLLQKHFFPKWMQVLCTWLGSMPNYNEVTKWYMGWKSMFPEPLASDNTVKEEFNKALNIMNRSVSGHFLPRENSPYIARPPIPPVPEPLPSVRTIPIASSLPTSFRDLLEKKAQEYGLLFMPIPNRTREAKQVYKFGKVQIYLDRSVVFMEKDGSWMPTSVSALVEYSK